MWNLKSCKEQLFFRDKTQAHRLHLQKMSTMKSAINCQNRDWNSTQKSCKSLSASPRTGFLEKSRIADIHHENSILLARIANINKLKKCSDNQRRHNASYSQHIESSMYRKRSRCVQEIRHENYKMNNRIVRAHPTLSRMTWEGSQQRTRKYKSNICISRFAKPDYTAEVSLSTVQKNKLFNHLRFKRVDKNLPKISRSFLTSQSYKLSNLSEEVQKPRALRG